MGAVSWWHWLLIIAAFILIFGAKKLPDAARGIGRSLRILKSEVSAMQEDGAKAKEADAAASQPAQIAPQAPVTPSTVPPAAPVTAAPVTAESAAQPESAGETAQ